jgi:hypothetical protein
MDTHIIITSAVFLGNVGWFNKTKASM